MANETKSEAGTAPRAPCPCGSGKRYKACHGKSAARATHSRVLRPFEGLAGEPDWVAMREIVPAATAELKLTGKDSDRSLQLSTVLPMAGPALVRQDGTIMLGCQTQTSSGDAARDIGDALQQAVRAEPGTAIAPRPLPPDAPRVQDLIDSSVAPRVVVHSGFDYWVDDAVELDAAATASMERANDAVMPTARLAAVEAAFWIVYGERRQLRWVLAGAEDVVVDALARLQTDGGLAVGEGSRYLGSFRALGLLVPVWDLADGVEVDHVEDPAAEFETRLTQALVQTDPLTGAERRARESLLARQLTVH